MDSRQKFGKETIAGHAGTKIGSILWCAGWLTSLGVLRMLRLYSGSAQACSPSTQVWSPSAQVKAAVAHVRRLKRNQRKGKLILSLEVLHQFSKRERDVFEAQIEASHRFTMGIFLSTVEPDRQLMHT
jgi:hypothetical protein